MRTLISAKILELVAGLAPQQILDRVIDRRGVRLDGDAVRRTQGVEVKRRHDRGDRGGRCLVSSDLQFVDVFALVIGVMDGPARQPQYLAFKLGEDAQFVRGDVVVHTGFDRHGVSHRELAAAKAPKQERTTATR